MLLCAACRASLVESMILQCPHPVVVPSKSTIITVYQYAVEPMFAEFEEYRCSRCSFTRAYPFGESVICGSCAMRMMYDREQELYVCHKSYRHSVQPKGPRLPSPAEVRDYVNGMLADSSGTPTGGAKSQGQTEQL